MSRTGWIGASATREQRVGRVAIYGVDKHTNNNVPDPCDAEAKAAAAICDLESGPGPGPLRRTPGAKMSRQEEKPKTLGFQGRGIESMSWKRAHTSDAPFVVTSPPSASTLRAVSNLVDNPQRLEPELKRRGEVCRGGNQPRYIYAQREAVYETGAAGRRPACQIARTVLGKGKTEYPAVAGL